MKKPKKGAISLFLEELPGVNSQGETLNEAKVNLFGALDLVMDTQRMLSEKSIGKRNVIKESHVFASRS